MYYYSPHTGEHINTDTPAPWMSATDKVPPTANNNQSAHFNGTDWELVDAVPEIKTVVGSMDIFNKFTREEQLAIVGASMTDASIKLWYDKLMASMSVDTTDSEFLAGVSELIAAKVITKTRINKVLTF